MQKGTPTQASLLTLSPHHVDPTAFAADAAQEGVIPGKLLNPPESAVKRSIKTFARSTTHPKWRGPFFHTCTSHWVYGP